MSQAETLIRPPHAANPAAHSVRPMPAIEDGRHPVANLGSNGGSIDLNLLIVFDAVMQERNLTRAGRRLGLSQPAASHALARLRAQLRDELFIRTPDGMTPTPRAEEMAGPVRESLRLLRVTLEPEAFDPAATNRVFTLAVNNYAARAVVPSLARRLGEQAPAILLNVEPLGKLDVLDQLDRGADLALTALVDGGERFKCVRIMEDDFVAVLDRQHPATRDSRFTVEHLAQIPHLAVTSSGDDTSFIDEALGRHGLARRIAVRVPLLAVVLMLVGSDRVTILPRRVATDLAQVCPLAVRDLPFASPRIALAMIWHRRLDNHAAHRWLREAIRRSAAQHS